MHPEEPVRDFGLAALIPGFIDLHTHLEYTAMRGLVDDLPYSQWKLQVMRKESLFSAQDWDDSALFGAMGVLQSGITTIADITETGASARAAQASGVRSVIYREVSTMDRRRVAEAMEQAADDIVAWSADADPECARFGIAPHAPYSCHPELFEKVAEYAAGGAPVAIHLAGSHAEYQFVKYGSSMLAIDVRDVYDEHAPLWLPTGVSPVRYVLQWGLFDAPNVMAVHCTQVDEDDIDVLAHHDVSVAHCPRCNTKLAMGIAPVGKMLSANIRLGLGTDSPAASNSTDMFEEMRIGLLLQRALFDEAHFMTARQFVKIATLDAARALRMDDEIGSIEPGKRADLVAVDLSEPRQTSPLNPYGTLVHTTNPDNVLWTMVGGKVRYDRHDAQSWSGIDHERLLARVGEMREKLLGGTS